MFFSVIMKENSFLSDFCSTRRCMTIFFCGHRCAIPVTLASTLLIIKIKKKDVLQTKICTNFNIVLRSIVYANEQNETLTFVANSLLPIFDTHSKTVIQ